MTKRKTYKTAIYIRLSREDGDNMESESIKNQRELIRLYIEKTKEDLIYVNEYVDDGWSGSNFDRPSWKRLMEDIKNDKINAIITKDLSRMGRDYIRMGEYIEIIFPENDIRYIAINDDIDTLYETPGMEFLQFKLMFNDYYLKDTSKKIKRVLKTKKEKGEFLGWKAPYGYMKDPNDKHKLIIDEAVEGNIKRMFNLILDGKSPTQIANIFSAEKIPTPSNYANLNRSTKSTAYEFWCSRTISSILENPTYTGNLTQGRMKKVNYKSKKQIRVDRENWIIKENTHEPIIDLQTFMTVQKILKKNKNKTNSKNIKLLSGFMFCKECGHAIGINKSVDGKRFYTCCTYYTKYSKYNLCTSHCCNYQKIENAVMEQLKKVCHKYIDSSIFENEIDKINAELDIKMKKKKEIDILNRKIKNNIQYIDRIYEDKLQEKIDLDMYNRLTIKYKDENEQNKNKIKILEEELDNIGEKEDKKSDTFQIINNYLSLKKPTRNLLANLIDKIVIDANKNIEIYYTFKLY